MPKATQAPIKKKTTKSSSDVVKIYQPTDSRSGDVKDVQEAITGKDLVTGKKLSKTDRVITAAASVIPVVSGKSVNTIRKATKSPAVKSAVKSGTKKLKQSTKEIMKKAKDGIQKIGKEVTNDIKDVDKKVPSKVKDDVKIESGNSGEKVKKGGKTSDLNGVRIINKKYAGKVFELSGDLGKKYPNGVKFSEEGFPDFEPYSIKKVTVDNLEGDAYFDFIKANEVAGFSSTPKGYTWHHVDDGRTLILVPSDIHGAVRHTGGASLIRQGIRP